MISVIILTYNRINQLLRCLDSLYEQNYSDLEIIIVDNGSTDNTPTILNSKNYPNLRLINNKDRTNFAHSRNLGFQFSKGDKIAFIDDDCVAEKNWLKIIDSDLNKYDAVGGLVVPFTNLKYPKWWHDEMGWMIGISNPGHSDERAGIVCYPQTANLAIRREVLEKEKFQDIKGDFKDGNFVYVSGREDAELWRRLRINGYNTFFDKNLLVYHDIPQDRLNWSYVKKRAFTDGATFFNRERKNEYIWTAMYDIFCFPERVLKTIIDYEENKNSNIPYKYLWTIRQLGFLKSYADYHGKLKTYSFFILNFFRFYFGKIKGIVKQILRKIIKYFYYIYIYKKKNNFQSKITNKTGFKNILIFACGFLGDMVVLIPSLCLLRKSFPESNIVLVCFENGSILLQNENIVNKIFTIKINLDKNYKQTMDLYLKEINQVEYDVCLIYYIHNIPSIIPFKTKSYYLIGHDKDLGFKRQIWYDFIHEKVKKDANINEIENNLNIIQKLGISGKAGKYSLHFTNDEIDKNKIFLDKHDLIDNNIIAIHIGTQGEHKRWNPEKWIDLINIISKINNYKFLFIGSKEERKNADEIIKQINADNCNICGETNPRELCLLLKYCNLLITTDSGPKHIAFLADIPTITLYITDTKRWKAYWDEEKHRIVEIKIFNLTFEEKLGLPPNHFINWITPDMVISEYKFLLEHNYIK